MARWFLWILLLAVWTAALVMPVPAPEELPLGEYMRKLECALRADD